MGRKEEIIHTTLELASQHGLSNVSMDKIAKKLGIRKPSLYNHFKSKEEIISAMYQYLRDKAREKISLADIDYGKLVKGKSVEEVLIQAVANYNCMNTNDELFLFYKVVYSERAINPIAAKIMTEETRRMILATKNLFYAMQVHGMISFNDIDMAATSFAMTIHAMTDYQLDCSCSGEPIEQNMISSYIKWFCSQQGGKCYEKNND